MEHHVCVCIIATMQLAVRAECTGIDHCESGTVNRPVNRSLGINSTRHAFNHNRWVNKKNANWKEYAEGWKGILNQISL